MLPVLRTRAAAGWGVRRLRELADPLAVRRAGITGPLPPRRLRARTGAPGVREFVEGGHASAQALEEVLTASGLPALGDHRAILDFGCGSARVLPHVLARAPRAALSGCDVDPAAIEWARGAFPQFTLAVSRAEPPLPFADGSADLVYSISVFSHLDEPLQDRWLRELRRVLRPGGVALLSTHGAHAFEQFRSDAVLTGWSEPAAFARGPLGADEIVFVPYARSVWNTGELPGVSEAYGLTFHGDAYLHRRWGEVLEICAVAPAAMAGWQDVVVCRRN